MMKKSMNVYQLTLVALMTALACVLGPLSIPIPISPVPISLTQIPIYLAGYLLGWKLGTLSYVVYFLLGTIGLPVFSGFSGGLGKVAGPTGGYLIGFIFTAIVAGYFIEKSGGKVVPSVIGMALGDAFAYLFGTIWLCYLMKIGFLAGLATGVLPYLLGDALKIAACAVIGPVLRKALYRASGGKLGGK